jgi:ABC-type multidrug transport system fused ATPase/permease subunit
MIEQCDEIYVLDKGGFIEHGTHQELMKKKGKYFEMVKLQNIRKGK